MNSSISIRVLKSFVNERLSVAMQTAAKEIFVALERIISEYDAQAFSSKQQIEQQQRILDLVLKPDVKLHRTVIPEKRQRIVKMFEGNDDEEEDDAEDFPGFPALDDEVSLDLEEPHSPLQIEDEQVETGWSTLSLPDMKLRGDTASDVSSEVQERSQGEPEIKEEPEEFLIIANTSTLTSPDRKPQLDSLPDSNIQTEGPVVKRGRGRPRKMERRGRPRKDQVVKSEPWDQVVMNDPGHPGPVLPVRLPGRPRKQQQQQQQVVENEPGHPGPVLPVRPVGRPRKQQQVVKNEPGPLPFRLRLRGRPRTLDGCARTNLGQHERRSLGHPIYPTAHDSLHLPVCKEEGSSSSWVQVDNGTSQPTGEDQLLAPLSYRSESDAENSNWEETFGARPARRSLKKSQGQRSSLSMVKRGRGRPRKEDELPGQTPPTRTVNLEELMANKGFYCTFCGKKFLVKAYLKSHLMIHTGEKPFGCRFCDQRFRHRGTQIGHERTHTGEKPYGCQFCDKRFSQRGNMIQHIKKHLVA